ARDGVLTHEPGHALDMLYLGVPLRGDFQLDCELKQQKRHELRVAYGGMAVGPQSEPKHVLPAHYRRAPPQIPILPPPPLGRHGSDGWYKYRLVVQGGLMTSFVNGRQIHRSALPADADPWLALYSDGPGAGGARNIKISGRPTIPDRLSLSALPDLTVWRAD